MNRFKKFKYTLEHKIVMLKLEKQIFGKNSLRIVLHDADKLILLMMFIPYNIIKEFHNKFAAHHKTNINSPREVIIESILDWESARYSKPDKPMNARETCIKIHSDLKEVVFPICDEMNI